MLVMMIYVDDGNCVVDCDDKHVVRDILPGSHLLPIFSLVILNKNVFHSFFFSRETLIMIFILGPTRKGGMSVSRYQQCMAENHSEDIFFRGENKKQCTGLLFCRIHCIVQNNEGMLSLTGEVPACTYMHQTLKGRVFQFFLFFHRSRWA